MVSCEWFNVLTICLFALLHVSTSFPYVQCAMVLRTSTKHSDDHFSLTKDYTIARLRRKICKNARSKKICIPNPNNGTTFHEKADAYGCDEIQVDARNSDYDLVCQGAYGCPFDNITVEGVSQRVEYCCCSQDMCYFSNVHPKLLEELSSLPFWRQLYRRVCNATLIFTILSILTVIGTIIIEVIKAGCHWPKPQVNKKGGEYAETAVVEEDDEETVKEAGTKDTVLEVTQDEGDEAEKKNVSQFRKTELRTAVAKSKEKERPPGASKDVVTAVAGESTPTTTKTGQVSNITAASTTPVVKEVEKKMK